jgi:UDP-N-acetylglucosamine 2-epimerase (non-hydrolysing)
MSDRPKVCVLIGTRPEAIKTWPVIAELQASGRFEVQVVLTGQHQELLHQAVELLGLPVTMDLAVMTYNQSLDGLTATLSTRIAEALRMLSPDWVLVQGDTTTVFVGALMAFYAGIPVGHIEAGLRSDDVRHPFPEEMNRRLCSVLADVHFAPTERARAALAAENIPAQRIHVTGNTGIDALRMMQAQVEQRPVEPALDAALAACAGQRIIAVTVHRRENRPFMRDIAHALADILDAHPEASIIFPAHLAPAVQQSFTPVLGSHDRCHLLAPMDYANFVRLLSAADLVLTDSGGIQEEAPYLGKPVLVMRRTTERPEAVEAGAVRLVGEQPDAIRSAVVELLTDRDLYARMAQPRTPYGDGFAAGRIVEVLQRETQKRSRPAGDSAS